MRKTCCMCHHANIWHRSDVHGENWQCYGGDSLINRHCMCNNPAYSFEGYFYNVYLPLHKKPLTKLLHLLGVVATVAFIVAALYFGYPYLLILAPFIVYCFAWPAHWWVEKNQPAAFSNPFYAKLSDLYMCSLLITGQLSWRGR